MITRKKINVEGFNVTLFYSSILKDNGEKPYGINAMGYFIGNRFYGDTEEEAIAEFKKYLSWQAEQPVHDWKFTSNMMCSR